MSPFRLRGIVASLSHLPTFRRRFRNLVKVLYVEAVASDDRVGGVAVLVESDKKSPGEAEQDPQHLEIV